MQTIRSTQMLLFSYLSQDADFRRDKLITLWEKCRDEVGDDLVRAELDRMFADKIIAIDKELLSYLTYTE